MSWLSSIIGGGKTTENKAASGAVAGTAESSLHLLIDRKEYPIVEASVRTFRIKPYDGDLIPKQSFGFTMVLNLGGEEHKSMGRGVVRTLSEKDGLIAQFTAPSPAFDKKLMEHLARAKSANRPAAPCKPAKGH